MKKRMLSSIVVVMMMLLLAFSVSFSENTNTNIIDSNIPLADGENNSISSIEFVKGMGAGWNLGNSFCCYNNMSYGQKTPTYYENLWGNPVTTKTTIDAVKNQGFKTVRIPVTYRNHIDENNQIEQQWLARLKVVVDYVLEDDMYCIINVHHEDWLVADYDKKEYGEKRLEEVWKQIAEYFKDYNDRLIFESFNEVINSAGQWDVANQESYDVVNSYNQVFVNTVRATGGNNSSRFLVVKPYAAKATKSVLDGFVLPQDSVSDRLIVSAHIYDGAANASSKFDNLYNKFVSKGVPVIVGEWGSVNGPNNTEEKRIDYASRFLSIATELGISCIWWDDGGIFKSSSAVTNFAILQRKTGEWYFKNLADEIVSDSILADKTEFQPADAADEDDVLNMKNINNWQTGDYSYIDGQYIASSSRLCVKGDHHVVANSTYTANISDENYHLLIRVMNENGEFLKTYNLANGDNFTVDSNEYTIRVSIYNYAKQSILYSYKEYKELFNNGFVATISGKVFAAEEDKTISDDEFGMTKFENWRSGNYSYKDGQYITDNSRICLLDYMPVENGISYKAMVSDNDYKILVRYMDSKGNMIQSVILSNSDIIKLPEQTTNIAISLYNSQNNKMIFSDYTDLFESGFEAKLVKIEDDYIKKNDCFNMTDFANWRTGNYSYKNGLYITDNSRVCLLDYADVSENSSYIANINDNDYKILVRYMNDNNEMKESLILNGGDKFTIPEGVVKIGISIYNSKNSKMTFEDYKKVFESGLTAYLVENK